MKKIKYIKIEDTKLIRTNNVISLVSYDKSYLVLKNNLEVLGSFNSDIASKDYLTDVYLQANKFYDKMKFEHFEKIIEKDLKEYRLKFIIGTFSNEYFTYIELTYKKDGYTEKYNSLHKVGKQKLEYILHDFDILEVAEQVREKYKC